MNTQLIRDSLQGSGPFIIRTSDGRQYRAPHPDFVLVGRANLVIERTNGLLHIIDPLQVVSVQPAPARRHPPRPRRKPKRSPRPPKS